MRYLSSKPFNSKPPTDAYSKGWEATFGKKKDPWNGPRCPDCKEPAFHHGFDDKARCPKCHKVVPCEK